VGKNAILGDPIENTIRAHNGGIDCPSQHQDSDHHNERAKCKPERQRSNQIHCQPADRIVEEIIAYGIGDDHHREKRDTGSEDQAVGKDDEARLFEVFQFGMLNLAVHLRHRLFAAHGQNRMAQANQNANEADGVGERGMTQPP
jgi:hypothetical protein